MTEANAQTASNLVYGSEQIKVLEGLEAVRLRKELREHQVQKLLNLSLESFEEKFGSEARKEIEDNAVYLFYTNQKRIRRNIRKIAELVSPNNPVAFIKPKNIKPTCEMVE